MSTAYDALQALAVAAGYASLYSLGPGLAATVLLLAVLGASYNVYVYGRSRGTATPLWAYIVLALPAAVPGALLGAYTYPFQLVLAALLLASLAELGGVFETAGSGARAGYAASLVAGFSAALALYSLGLIEEPLHVVYSLATPIAEASAARLQGGVFPAASSLLFLVLLPGYVAVISAKPLLAAYVAALFAARLLAPKRLHLPILAMDTAARPLVVLAAYTV